MSERHLIDEAVFELAQRTQGKAGASGVMLDEAAVQALVCDRLLPVVEEMLARYDEAECVIALQRLDLDLGEVEFARIEEELPRRLQAALAAELAARIHALPRATQESGGEAERRIDKIVRAREWLETFLFHGHVSQGADEAGSPQEWLRMLGSEEARQLARNIALSAQRACALERLSLQFDETSLIALLRAISPPHAESAADGMAVVAGLEPIEAAQRAWLRAALDAAIEGDEPPSVEPWSAAWRKTESQIPAEEYAELDAALVIADQAALRALWPSWNAARRATLRERIVAQRAANLAQWIAHFNESLLRDMLTLLSAARAAFVAPLLDQPALFLLGRPDRRESREAHGRRVLQVAFEQDPQTEFDDTAATALLARILSLGETQQAFERATGYVLTWRRALKRANHIAGARALDRWLSAHARGALPTPAHSGFTVEAGTPPALQPPQLAAVTLSRDRAAEDILRERIESFAANPERFEPSFRADFLQSVEQHLPAAPHRAAYYEAIWMALEEMLPVDLEAISTQATAAPVKHTEASNASAALEAPPSAPASRSATPMQMLSERLHGMRDLDQADAALLAARIEESCARNDEETRRMWAPLLSGSLATARIVQAAGPSQLQNLLALFRAQDHLRIRCIAQAARRVFAQVQAGAESAAAQRSEQLMWRFVFRHFHAGEGNPNAAFVEGLALYLLQQSAQAPKAQFRAAIDALLKQLERVPLNGEFEFDLPQQASQTATDARTAAAPPSQPAIKEEVHVENAGLVLAAPYLPRLFTLLKLMDKGVFVDEAAAERAVHLLQFLATEEAGAPEHRLVLNKQLCGVRTGKPLAPGIDILREEKEVVEQLLNGILAHWKILGSTSIAGLRQSFLRRHGTLWLKDDAWHLHVQPMPYDMLLDQLPWSYKLVKHPWMQRPIHTVWR